MSTPTHEHPTTGSMEEIDSVMSNFDRVIEDDVAKQLREKPGEVQAGYPGWKFYARVYFYEGRYHAEIWVYCVTREIISADTLQELMDFISGKYGWD